MLRPNVATFSIVADILCFTGGKLLFFTNQWFLKKIANVSSQFLDNCSNFRRSSLAVVTYTRFLRHFDSCRLAGESEARWSVSY